MNDKATHLDEERKYLEQLLNTRFNFYLVFASLFTVAVFSSGITLWQKTVALLFGTIISYFMQRSVKRTHQLVELALDEIGKPHSEHPYARITAKLPKKEKHHRANQYLVLVPPLMLALFFFLFLFSLINLICELGVRRPAWLSYLQK